MFSGGIERASGIKWVNGFIFPMKRIYTPEAYPGHPQTSKTKSCAIRVKALHVRFLQ